MNGSERNGSSPRGPLAGVSSRLTAGLACLVLLTAGCGFGGSSSGVGSGDPDTKNNNTKNNNSNNSNNNNSNNNNSNNNNNNNKNSDPPPQGKSVDVDSITRHGITWTFDKKYKAGTYCTGDWWVVGPVKIVKVDPPSTKTSGRTINGSMVNPTPKLGNTHGFDSKMYGAYEKGHYKEHLNVAYGISKSKPMTLGTHSSLLSTISHSKAGNRPQLTDLSILTVVAKVPPEGSFRPNYCGNDKTAKHYKKQLDYSLLKKLKPVKSTPALSKLERQFERPWMDHIPNWMGQEYSHPINNMPNYGREFSAAVSEASLALHLDYSNEKKEKLLIGLVQLGIDLWGVAKNGGHKNWVAAGGHASGRKWPILFAGMMLGDKDMMAVGSEDIAFGPDQQTFFVKETSPGKFNNGHGGYTKDHKDMPEWGIDHLKAPHRDSVKWSALYRRCCTANAWSGWVLSARLMKAQGLWKHDALFAYMDRYIKVCRDNKEANWMVSWSAFQIEMWDAYRATAK